MINSNILIIGDVMLDEYWLGTSNSISPEASVPVVIVQSKIHSWRRYQCFFKFF
jgi:bifunctional ADP-heptose synthase (sugar kinase/adenylyltransferase)